MMKKRILSLVLCLALTLGMAAPVYAEDAAPAVNGVEVTVEPDSSAPVEAPGEVPAVPAPDEDPGAPSTPPDEIPSESVPPEPTKPKSPPDETPPAETEPPAPTEKPEPPSAAPECTCGSQDGLHAETCPLYIAPVIDGEALRESLLSLESESAFRAFVEGLSAEEYAALVSVLTEEDILAFAARCGISLEESGFTPAKNYTEVGPLGPPISVADNKAYTLLRVAAEEPENGLILDKQAVYDSEKNTARITLEAYTTGTVTSSEQSVPADIVLVLDESGSMTDKMYEYTRVYSLKTSNTYYVKNGDSYSQVHWCTPIFQWTHKNGWYTGVHFVIHWGYRYNPMTSSGDTTADHVQFYTRNATPTTKQDALKAAANTFVEAVYNDAIKNNVDHRISVIGFSGKNKSAIKIGLTADIRNNKGDSVSPARGTVLYAINQLSASGETYIEEGMAKAKQAFDGASSPSAGKRNRVVIVFTDGVPGTGSWNNTTISDSANPAIAASRVLKNSYGATVYTIGMLDDADPELPISDEANNMARTNKFLHYLSSNYPTASSMSNNSLNGGNAGYYLSASDTESLSVIFEKISKEIASPAIELGADTTIRDIVSQYFTLPLNTTDVTVETYDCLSFNDSTGAATWSGSGTALAGSVTFVDRAINVTGFDFTKNFISKNPKPGTQTDHGKKIVISFDVATRAGFWGGDEVPTNDSASGVYDKTGVWVESFLVPHVNVPVRIPAPDPNNLNVYYGNSITAADLYTAHTQPDETSPDYWKSEYIDFSKIGYAVTDAIQSPVIQGQSYSIDVTYNNLNVTAGLASTATVTVFKPIFTVTAKDIWADYGLDIDLSHHGLEAPQVLWKHEDTPSTVVTMKGIAPAIAGYIFGFTEIGSADGTLAGSTYTAGELDADFNVGLSSCTVGSMSYTVPSGALTVTKAVPEEGHDFTVHINRFKMTIRKTFIGAEIYKQDSIFTITGGAAPFQVVIPAGGATRTVIGLVCGKTYTVTEDSDWSWRYRASGPETFTCVTTGISNTPPSEEPVKQGDIGITNTLYNERWLSGSNMKSNLFGASTRRRAAREER